MNRCRFRTMPKGKNATLPTIYDTTGTQLPLCGKAIRGYAMPSRMALFKNNTLKDFSLASDLPGTRKRWKMSVRGGFGFYDQTSSDCLLWEVPLMQYRPVPGRPAPCSSWLVQLNDDSLIFHLR